jgi:hypothetical protein
MQMTIRMTTDNKAAAIDIVMVATGNDNHYDAAKVIKELEKGVAIETRGCNVWKDDNDEWNQTFMANLEKFQFLGAGQSEIHVVNADEAMVLLHILPGKEAWTFKRSAEYLRMQIWGGYRTWGCDGFQESVLVV